MTFLSVDAFIFFLFSLPVQLSLIGCGIIVMPQAFRAMTTTPSSSEPGKVNI
jgi:hypothetical protein